MITGIHTNKGPTCISTRKKISAERTSAKGIPAMVSPIQDITAAISISKGKLPPRPGHPAISQGLTDGLWALMMKCWKGDPQDRPLMTAVKADIKKLRGDTGLSPNPCTATHCQCLLSSDTIYSPAPTILTSSPIQIHTELAPESPKSIPPKRKINRAAEVAEAFYFAQLRPLSFKDRTGGIDPIPPCA